MNHGEMGAALTEHNHRRGSRGRRCRSAFWSFGGMPSGEAKEWQRIAHGERRALVRQLISAERFDDIPANTPKHIRWDYW